jgi:hypothetical protein
MWTTIRLATARQSAQGSRRTPRRWQSAVQAFQARVSMSGASGIAFLFSGQTGNTQGSMQTVDDDLAVPIKHGGLPGWRITTLPKVFFRSQ